MPVMTEAKRHKSNDQKEFDILIIGAGIAGATTAIGLKRAGHNVVILERMPELPTISESIQIPPNGTRALEQLGVLTAVSKHAIALNDVSLRSYSDGSLLGKLELLPHMMERYLSPYLASQRVAFLKSIEDEARKLGVQIELGCMISSIDFEGASVNLIDGRMFNGDLIIGCDGALSQCRSLLLRRPDPPRHFGNKIFSCEFSQELLLDHEDLRDLIDLPGTPCWIGPGSLCIGNVVHENKTFNLIGGLEEPMTNEVQTHPQLSDMEEVKVFFKNWDPTLRKLLDLAPFCIKWTLTAIPDLHQWSHPAGKFILLGDSAHAMIPYLGQGAAQCMEDAVVLSRLLEQARHREQIPDVLTVFEDIRKPRVLPLKRRSEEMRDVYCMQDGPQQAERDRQLRDMEPYADYPIPWLDPEYLSWMYSYDAVREADDGWKKYCEGKWPGTRGAWKLNRMME
ncbi:hypothetical protein BJ875DRAFT_415228 [Amylocarpus encephaloides]|uniref:FAD-binding domain-containing protein n=1 Tax=Amylocarpus encephaloides TaxID=45428 RepID=A0A9P7YSK8_9HELO|nr:hypothetical protein BJ875DRAFT_415228 [Amylocarpus encephaloides]